MKATEQQTNAINEVMRKHDERVFNETLEQMKNTYTLNPHRTIKTWSEYYAKHKQEIDNSILSKLK